jgi:hypothetical protein
VKWRIDIDSEQDSFAAQADVVQRQNAVHVFWQPRACYDGDG